MIRRRGRRDIIVELAVDYAVSNVEDIALVVKRRFRDRICKVLWESAQTSRPKTTNGDWQVAVPYLGKLPRAL